MSVLSVMRHKLRVGRAMSSFGAFGAVLVMAVLAGPGRAHEVLPTIAKLSTDGRAVQLEFRLNAEAYVAGINLDGLEDTNESDRSDIYDELRALSPDAMADRVTQSWPQIAEGIVLSSDQGDITLNLRKVEVSEVGNVELSRPTRLILDGEMPQGTQSLTLSWPLGYGTLALRHVGVENGFAGYLEGGETSDSITLEGGQAETGLAAFLQYIPIGFDHILPKGLDHILFVLGLFFLSAKIRPLLWQVSAFTVAHTVTLALGALGVVNVPPTIVEPLIAASIAFIAVENIFATGLTRWRPVVVFAFGLLHGLGFASVLQEFGLPQSQFIPALIGFNVGVELGQLTVIALAFLMVGAWFGEKRWYRPVIAIPASLAIACIGLFWAVERTFL